MSVSKYALHLTIDFYNLLLRSSDVLNVFKSLRSCSGNLQSFISVVTMTVITFPLDSYFPVYNPFDENEKNLLIIKLFEYSLNISYAKKEITLFTYIAIYIYAQKLSEIYMTYTFLCYFPKKINIEY